MNYVELKNVSKIYKGGDGVRDISFSISKGKIAGLIGPNGAGKSTIIKMIAGILLPDSGEINVMGFNPGKDIKTLSKKYGIMFGNRSSLWYNLAAKESLLLMKDIYNISDEDYEKTINKYAKIIDATNLVDKKVRNMSLGERIKIEILVSLINEPELLIYDEPTLGLDITSKLAFRKILNDIRAEGKTILITTHDLVDVEKLCDNIILINKGRKLLDITHEDFRKMQDENLVLISKVDLKIDTKFFVEENHGEYKYIIPQKEAIMIKSHSLDKLPPNEFYFRSPNLEELLYVFYK